MTNKTVDKVMELAILILRNEPSLNKFFEIIRDFAFYSQFW